MSSEYIYRTHQAHIEPVYRYYVYVYFDPFTKEPFYVGKGTGRRAEYHIKEATNKPDRDSYKLRKIRKIINKGKLPRIVIAYSFLDNKEACVIEQSLIAYYGRADHNEGILTNSTDGGDEKYKTAPIDNTIYQFQHRDGTIVNKTQGQMVEDYGLHYASVHYLISGKMVSAGGWYYQKVDHERKTCRTNELHTFQNCVTKEFFTGTQNDLVNLTGASPGLVSSVVNADCKRKKVHNWYLNKAPQKEIDKYNKKYKFINRYTEEVRYYTIMEFKENIRSDSKIYELFNGKRNFVCGWYLAD